MNETQKMVLLVTAAIVGLMVLFPPYVVLNYKHVAIMAGYGFLFNLPSYLIPGGGEIPASVNANTLLLEIVGAVIVGGLVFLATKR